jgi:hypothetical protein
MSGHNTSGPLLTTLSNYQSSPKWSIRHDRLSKDGVVSVCREWLPGPAAYNPISCVDKTSKFRKIASSCAFNNSKRFPSDSSKLVLAHAPPGPGSYNPPSDFSSAPHPSMANVTFSRQIRTTRKRTSNIGACSIYDIRGLHRRGGSTFDPKGVVVNQRHGWYYDGDIKSRRSNPGPGAYNPAFPQEKTDRKFSFGTGSRPELSIPSSNGIPAPGQYLVSSTLSRESHSFTRSSHQSSSGPSTAGPICGQPTQFG